MILGFIELGFAGPTEWRALGGAQVDTNSHGEVDFGVRKGSFSAEWFTDTLDIRWSPSFSGGGASVGFRAEGAGAAMMFEGNPPVLASYAGPDAKIHVYGPHGFYAGVGGALRTWAFSPIEGSLAPGAHLVESVSAEAGWWSPLATFSARGGSEFVQSLDGQAHAEFGPNGPVGAPVSPWISGAGSFVPAWFVAPHVRATAEYAPNRGPALATAVGGSMPYVVPVAGHAWGEARVTSVLAARVGVAVGNPLAAPGSGAGSASNAVPDDVRVRVRGGIAADAAYFSKLEDCAAAVNDGCTAVIMDHQSAFGVGATFALRVRKYWAETEIGVPLSASEAPFTVMIRLGADWAKF